MLVQALEMVTSQERQLKAEYMQQSKHAGPTANRTDRHGHKVRTSAVRLVQMKQQLLEAVFKLLEFHFFGETLLATVIPAQQGCP